MKPDTIYRGDTLEVMSKWPDGCVDLVFTDPPYNIGYVYDKYKDDIPDDQYIGWCRDWMAECSRLLTNSGSFYIAIGDDFAAQLRMLGKDLGLHLRNWIIWRYTFGQHMRYKFGRAHTHILYFTKHPANMTFNDHLLRYPSARHTEYQDLRANPKGRLPDDVWDEFPRVCGTFKERDGFHGCQLPEALLTRIIMASSNPGDVVLDPLVGTGTTAVVAKRLGRRYVGIDISEEYVERTRQRLAKTPDESQVTPNADRLASAPRGFSGAVVPRDESYARKSAAQRRGHARHRGLAERAGRLRIHGRERAGAIRGYGVLQTTCPKCPTIENSPPAIM